MDLHVRVADTLSQYTHLSIDLPSDSSFPYTLDHVHSWIRYGSPFFGEKLYRPHITLANVRQDSSVSDGRGPLPIGTRWTVDSFAFAKKIDDSWTVVRTFT